MDKERRARLFRERLLNRLNAIRMSRSALARACGADRSTIAQLLNGDDLRMPNAHLAAQCAQALGVSSDWLLGLSDKRETAAEILDTTFRLSDARRTPADNQILEWHREAAGHKIRHVPATVPDLLKTDAVLEFEYSAFLDKTPEQAGQAMRDAVRWMRQPGSDYEICVPVHKLQALARGEGYWSGLSERDRAEQIHAMADMCEQHYPSLRLYLHDQRKVFSAPVTIFGPLLAVIYVGSYYMVYREARQVRALTEHFDRLVRDSEIDARGAGAVIRSMLQT